MLLGELVPYIPRLFREFDRPTRMFTREDRQDAFQSVLCDILGGDIEIEHLDLGEEEPYVRLRAWFQKCVGMRCFQLQRDRASKKTDVDGNVLWYDRFLTDAMQDPAAFMAKITDTHSYAVDPAILAEQADEEREAMYVRSLLTPEELRIYQLREADATTREIALLTGIPQRTVCRRLDTITRKLL